MTERTYTIAGIAAALGVNKSAVTKRAAKEGWAYTEQAVRGGKQRFYALATLPKEVSEALNKLEYNKAFAEIKEAPQTAPAKAPVAVIPRADGAIVIRGQTRKARKDADLTDKDRARQAGALILCRAIDAGIARAGCPAKRAMTELAGRILDGSAHPELIAAAAVTYTKPRKTGQTADALVSRLQKMHKAYLTGLNTGDAGAYLVPGRRVSEGFAPIHIRAFLIHFCRPNRPPLMEAWRDSEAWFSAQGYPRPAVDTFYRIEKSLPVTIKYRGRMTGGQWRSLLPYVERDVSMFQSNDIWVGDGHSFKAKVQHPIHGQPFTPEVTLIIDWVSRKIVGWSIDLAESTIAVSAAFRHAQVQTRARPLVYYSDNGGGQTGKLIDCAIHGTLARQGIAHETGIPGNAQGRGIIERIWQVTLIPLARTYPTCTWKGSDKENTRKMLVALNKKDGSAEKLLPAFGQFVTDIGQCVNDYNTGHSHSALNGNVPEAEYRARLDPDSVCYGPSDTEIDLQWMPEVARTPQRGVVSLFGNEYANKELVELLAEGEKVRVRFDIHNADQVWLLRMDGRFLCVAKWDAHKRAAFPVPFIEQKREDRATGKVKRGERIIKEAKAELGTVIEGEAEELVPFEFEIPAVKIAPEPELGLLDFLPPPKEKEVETTFADTVMWLYVDKQKDEEKEELAASS